MNKPNLQAIIDECMTHGPDTYTRILAGVIRELEATNYSLARRVSELEKFNNYIDGNSERSH